MDLLVLGASKVRVLVKRSREDLKGARGARLVLDLRRAWSLVDTVVPDVTVDALAVRMSVIWRMDTQSKAFKEV